MMRLAHKKILVIDDAASIRTFLRISLQAEGAIYFEASTANQGLELFEKEKPDLVVLDLGLPDRDGLDILPEIKKKNGEHSAPPVVVLTVRREHTIISKAYALGADAYISKPFLVEDLLEVIHSKVDSAA